MSAPATNALSPAPVRITARTSLEISSSPHAAVSSPITCDDSALSAASRDTVTIASGPSTTIRRVSNAS
jgi:hypothetical protein